MSRWRLGGLMAVGVLSSSLACTGDVPSGDTADAASQGGLHDGGGGSVLDKERAQMNFPSTTELVRRVIAPSCASEENECHFNENYPDMSTEANMWNLIDLRCNISVGERSNIENRCEYQGDVLRITDGGNANFSATIGLIRTIYDEASGEFIRYEIDLDTPLLQNQTGGNFEFLRGGGVKSELGGGSSLDATAGQTTVRITDVQGISRASDVLQGDENADGVYGDGSGVIIRRGSAQDSYFIARLLAGQSSRSRMPINTNADTANEGLDYLTPDLMYVVMSWINCMEPGDGPYSPIRYDCAANADNDGTL